MYFRRGNSQRRRECEDVESPLWAFDDGEEVTEELVTRPAVHSTCPMSSMTAEQSRYFSQDSREIQMMTRPLSSASWQAGYAIRVSVHLVTPKPNGLQRAVTLQQQQQQSTWYVVFIRLD